MSLEFDPSKFKNIAEMPEEQKENFEAIPTAPDVPEEFVKKSALQIQSRFEEDAKKINELRSDINELPVGGKDLLQEAAEFTRGVEDGPAGNLLSVGVNNTLNIDDPFWERGKVRRSSYNLEVGRRHLSEELDVPFNFISTDRLSKIKKDESGFLTQPVVEIELKKRQNRNNVVEKLYGAGRFVGRVPYNLKHGLGSFLNAVNKKADKVADVIFAPETEEDRNHRLDIMKKAGGAYKNAAGNEEKRRREE